MATVLIVCGDSCRLEKFCGSISGHGHTVKISGTGNTPDSEKEACLLTVYIPGSIKEAIPALSEIKSSALAPVIIFDREGIFSADDEEEVLGLLEGFAVAGIFRKSSDRFAALRISRYIDILMANRDLNPLTGLPGNNTINRMLNEKIKGSNGEYSVIYTDLNDFKPYNDNYGFCAGDRVIRFLSGIFRNILEKCSRGSFLGHVGGDDFVMVVPAKDVDEVTGRIIEDFDRGIKSMYGEQDLNRGCIVSTDRDGRRQKFDLMTIAVASFSGARAGFGSVDEIGEYSGILKHISKKESKNRKQSYHQKGDCIELNKKSFSLYGIAMDNGLPVNLRKAVIEAMGEGQEKQYEGTLLALLKEEMPYRLKKSCIYAAGKLRSAGAVQPLMELAGDANPHLRSRAVEALANIGTAEALPVLIKALEDKNVHTRRMAALTLGRTGDSRAIPELLKVLESEDAELRKNAIKSIGELGANRAATIILQYLSDDDLSVRNESIRALGRMKDPGAMGRLLEILKTGNLQERESAVIAMVEIAKSCDVMKWEKDIIEKSKDGAATVRGLFMDLMGLMPGDRTRGRIIECLGDRSGWVRWHATLAIANHNDERASSIIVRQLGDSSEPVRHAAARALAGTGNSAALEPLRLALKDESPRVSREAAESIISIVRRTRSGLI